MTDPGRPRPPHQLPLALLVLAGLGIVAVSLVPEWLLHVRNVGGHGLTAISVTWSAWEGRAWPFLPLAVTLAALLALVAAIGQLRPGRVAAGWPLAIALVCLALLIGSAIPLDRQGYASSVHLTPRWALLVAIGLASAAVVVSASRLRRPRWLAAAAACLVLLAIATCGGRVVALDLAEGNPRHYADGSYLRTAADGQPAETLVISDGTYTIGDRWTGTITGRGLVAVLTDDPACPDARGTYRVFAAGGEDIRWNLIVDLCADGERAEDLTTGIWQRQP